jgi:hypothetical protein
VVEVQKANVGRKCVYPLSRHGGHSPLITSAKHHTTSFCRYAASKDRRALDPPPVTELHIYDVCDTGNGMTQETELDYRWA